METETAEPKPGKYLQAAAQSMQERPPAAAEVGQNRPHQAVANRAPRYSAVNDCSSTGTEERISCPIRSFSVLAGLSVNQMLPSDPDAIA